MLSFFPRDVLDEILNLTESASEGFPTYFYSELNEFDILAFAETWLNQSVLQEDIQLHSHCSPERKDRRGDRTMGSSFMSRIHFIMSGETT